MELKGKTALVTGGARRIGRAIALALAGRGANVAFTYLSSYEDAAAVAEEIRDVGGQALAIPSDLSEAMSPPIVVGMAVERFGALHVLVNNAAVFPRTPLEDADVKAWNRVMALNLRAPYLLSREAAAPMREAGGGVIVNITDIYAQRSLPDHVPYVVSKAGLEALTRAMARELAPDIRVNAVAPGAILWPKDMPEDQRAALTRRIPLGRKGEPEEVAEAVRFCIEGPEFLNGETLRVDGGRLLS